MIASLAEHYMGDEDAPQIEIGTGLKPAVRVEALLQQKIHIAMASHGIDVEQISEHGLKVHRIAKVAVVLAANKTVKVSDLSHQAVCDIYSANVTNWHQLGGADLPIVPLLRPMNEVDSEVVSAHISCFGRLSFRPDIEIKNKSGQMARALAQTPGALGMTTMVRVAQSDGQIRALAINGIKPITVLSCRVTMP